MFLTTRSKIPYFLSPCATSKANFAWRSRTTASLTNDHVLLSTCNFTFPLFFRSMDFRFLQCFFSSKRGFSDESQCNKTTHRGRGPTSHSPPPDDLTDRHLGYFTSLSCLQLHSLSLLSGSSAK
jgi:hypothetical protein